MKTRQPGEDRTGDSPGQPLAVLDVVFEAGAGRDRASQRARQRLLTAAGFHTQLATETSQALEAAAEHKPGIVLLNPGTSPPEDIVDFCRRLKDGPGNVPVIVLLTSAAKSGKNIERHGADLCLPSTLAPAFLVEAVRTLLRMRAAEREVAESRRELVDFSRQIAHDIEGPLRGVVTFAELIGQVHPLSANEQTYLGHVLSSADQVRRVARCFLSYAEVKGQPPRLTALPLRGVVTAALHALRERIKESAAIVEIQDPLPSALGDFSSIQQVVQILVTNAINYRRPDTSLTVTIAARKGSAGDWLISVSDNGIGVAKQYHESIFAPFKRLHGLEIPGAGMGLAICKQIVEAQGGRIWVESEPGRGASFLFSLHAAA